MSQIENVATDEEDIPELSGWNRMTDESPDDLERVSIIDDKGEIVSKACYRDCSIGIFGHSFHWLEKFPDGSPKPKIIRAEFVRYWQRLQ